MRAIYIYIYYISHFIPRKRTHCGIDIIIPHTTQMRELEAQKVMHLAQGHISKMPEPV